MKTTQFIPKAVSGFTVEREGEEAIKIEPTFKGHITLRIPNYFERQELKKRMLRALTSAGETDLEDLQNLKDKKFDVGAIMENLTDMVKESIPFYVTVALENIETGEKYTCFDDLSLDPSAEGIIKEVAQELAGGLALSKKP